MSDEPMAGEPAVPGAEQPPEPQASPLPPQAPQSAGGQWTKPGRRRNFLVGGVIVVFLAIVLFAVRNNVQADDLKVGDCFNIPDGTSFQTVEKLPCTDSHTGEVIFVGEYTGDTYPISLSLDSYLNEHCVTAFETYVGRAVDSAPELSIGYVHPTHDGWDNGDKTITCYLSQPDQSPMTESLKAT